MLVKRSFNYKYTITEGIHLYKAFLEALFTIFQTFKYLIYAYDKTKYSVFI